MKLFDISNKNDRSSEIDKLTHLELRSICCIFECIRLITRINLRSIMNSEDYFERKSSVSSECRSRYTKLEVLLQNRVKIDIMKTINGILELTEVIDMLNLMNIDIKLCNILLDKNGDVYLTNKYDSNKIMKENIKKKVINMFKEIMTEMMKYIDNNEERNILNKLLNNKNKEEMLLEEMRLILNNEMNINEDIGKKNEFMKYRMDDYYYENYHRIDSEIKSKIHEIIIKDHTHFGFNDCIYNIYVITIIIKFHFYNKIVKIGEFELEYITDSLLSKKRIHGMYFEKNEINDKDLRYLNNYIMNFNELKSLSFNGI